MDGAVLDLEHMPESETFARAEQNFPRVNFSRIANAGEPLAETGRPSFRPASKAPFSSAEPLQALGLSTDEAGVLLLVAQRKSNQDIANVLGIERAEAKRQVRALLFKLDVLDRYAAAVKALALLRPRCGEE